MEKKTDKNTENFPGYPHYPASQDITQSNNNNGKIALDATPVPGIINPSGPVKKSDSTIVNEADVTAEDLKMLESADQNIDSSDNENLRAAALDERDNEGELLNEAGPADFTGDDLDIPGVELDDSEERIGEEDEENNYYSLGGDNHENQEENKGE